MNPLLLVLIVLFVCYKRILLVFGYVTRDGAVVAASDARLSKLQSSFLFVYGFGVAADWLQGPYVYALYEHYKIEYHYINILFVMGFGSSMIAGTIVGSFADKYGRKLNVMVYGVLYSLACVTKHFPNYYILMLGRFLAGIATSILFSAFDSWLVNAHNKLNFSENHLGSIFSNMVTLNGGIAIVAGLSSQYIADWFGFVAPFDAAIICLVVMMILTNYLWEENYGDAESEVSENLKDAFSVVTKDKRVLCLGLTQSLFEASMYVFVQNWTPSLGRASAKETGDDSPISFGLIFTAFMMCVMLGSFIFKSLNEKQSIPYFLRFFLLLAAFALAPSFYLHQPNTVSWPYTIQFGLFLLFELCVGVFWPSVATLRGQILPENSRATIMNLFRIPLNCIVIVLLLQKWEPSTFLTISGVMLSVSAISCQVLHVMGPKSEKGYKLVNVAEM